MTTHVAKLMVVSALLVGFSGQANAMLRSGLNRLASCIRASARSCISSLSRSEGRAAAGYGAFLLGATAYAGEQLRGLKNDKKDKFVESDGFYEKITVDYSSDRSLIVARRDWYQREKSFYPTRGSTRVTKYLNDGIFTEEGTEDGPGRITWFVDEPVDAYRLKQKIAKFESEQENNQASEPEWHSSLQDLLC